MLRPPFAKPLESIRVKGHGPAMHDALTSLNSFPTPASRVAEPVEAFQFPSGEQSGWRTQGTFPLLTAWKVLTALPIFDSVVELTVYLTLMLDTTIGGLPGRTADCSCLGTILATYSSLATVRKPDCIFMSSGS